ncbi:hypothetical protein O7543_18240 [Solwaraspora sp. WMMA2080]|uniref:hypothetical protein n=1 Tax=unclassified Solwaraspora TaxID=2627926 RepID=UPI00248B32E2|nr:MULTISPECIES: hypothetical protein [unclassified Solwaraspora]WBB97266.1 hypothetical protein O7553_29130 [Solwaraspora sp. WMMA2059]WBC18833.1 hypothetical protein O7543_18240 [Solwaraspora sp. WMMA2080]
MRLVALGEIQALMGGISRQRTQTIVNRSDFPKPLDTLTVGRIWAREEVVAWIKQNRPFQEEAL